MNRETTVGQTLPAVMTPTRPAGNVVRQKKATHIKCVKAPNACLAKNAYNNDNDGVRFAFQTFK